MKILPTLKSIGTGCSSRALVDLTNREWDVLLTLSDDLPNAEIGERLCLTAKSVENYRTRISCKLDQKGSGKLARFARRYYHELREWYDLLANKARPVVVPQDSGLTRAPGAMKSISNALHWVAD